MPKRFGWLVIAYLAVLVYALLVYMPDIVDRYERLAANHPRLSAFYLGTVILVGVMLAGLTLWMFYRLWRNSLWKLRQRASRSRDPSQMSRAQRQKELLSNLDASRDYAQDENISPELRAEIEKHLNSLKTKQESCRLEIVAFGTISSGKSSLLNALAGRAVFASDVVGGTTSVRSEIPWPGADELVLVDTPGLAEVRGESRAALASAAAKDADLVLLVVDGPLKSYEVDLVRQLHNMEKRVVVCLNKEDWYDQEEQAELVSQISRQLPQVSKQDILAVRASSVTRQRVRISSSGVEEIEEVELPPNVQALADRLMQIVQRDGRELILANLLLQSRGIVDEAKDRVRAMLDARADEIIRSHMWAAGGVAGANPFPLLDLAGGSAITVKMVMELARVYRQQIDVDTVIKILEQLGKNLIAMVGATAATPAVVSGIATMLKTVPGVGTIAGGVLQGTVQALVTRWIGSVFVKYFQQEMKPPPGGIAEIARRQWQQLTQPSTLRKLVQTSRRKIDNHQASEENQ